MATDGNEMFEGEISAEDMKKSMELAEARVDFTDFDKKELKRMSLFLSKLGRGIKAGDKEGAPIAYHGEYVLEKWTKAQVSYFCYSLVEPQNDDHDGFGTEINLAFEDEDAKIDGTLLHEAQSGIDLEKYFDNIEISEMVFSASRIYHKPEENDWSMDGEAVDPSFAVKSEFTTTLNPEMGERIYEIDISGVTKGSPDELFDEKVIGELTATAPNVKAKVVRDAKGNAKLQIKAEHVDTGAGREMYQEARLQIDAKLQNAGQTQLVDAKGQTHNMIQTYHDLPNSIPVQDKVKALWPQHQKHLFGKTIITSAAGVESLVQSFDKNLKSLFVGRHFMQDMMAKKPTMTPDDDAQEIWHHMGKINQDMFLAFKDTLGAISSASSVMIQFRQEVDMGAVMLKTDAAGYYDLVYEKLKGLHEKAAKAKTNSVTKLKDTCDSMTKEMAILSDMLAGKEGMQESLKRKKSANAQLKKYKADLNDIKLFISTQDGVKGLVLIQQQKKRNEDNEVKRITEKMSSNKKILRIQQRGLFQRNQQDNAENENRLTEQSARRTRQREEFEARVKAAREEATSREVNARDNADAEMKRAQKNAQKDRDEARTRHAEAVQSAKVRKEEARVEAKKRREKAQAEADSSLASFKTQRKSLQAEKENLNKKLTNQRSQLEDLEKANGSSFMRDTGKVVKTGFLGWGSGRKVQERAYVDNSHKIDAKKDLISSVERQLRDNDGSLNQIKVMIDNVQQRLKGLDSPSTSSTLDQWPQFDFVEPEIPDGTPQSPEDFEKMKREVEAMDRQLQQMPQDCKDLEKIANSIRLKLAADYERELANLDEAASQEKKRIGKLRTAAQQTAKLIQKQYIDGALKRLEMRLELAKLYMRQNTVKTPLSPPLKAGWKKNVEEGGWIHDNGEDKIPRGGKAPIDEARLEELAKPFTGNYETKDQQMGGVRDPRWVKDRELNKMNISKFPLKTLVWTSDYSEKQTWTETFTGSSGLTFDTDVYTGSVDEIVRHGYESLAAAKDADATDEKDDDKSPKGQQTLKSKVLVVKRVEDGARLSVDANQILYAQVTRVGDGSSKYVEGNIDTMLNEIKRAAGAGEVFTVKFEAGIVYKQHEYCTRWLRNQIPTLTPEKKERFEEYESVLATFLNQAREAADFIGTLKAGSESNLAAVRHQSEMIGIASSGVGEEDDATAELKLMNFYHSTHALLHTILPGMCIFVQEMFQQIEDLYLQVTRGEIMQYIDPATNSAVALPKRANMLYSFMGGLSVLTDVAGQAIKQPVNKALAIMAKQMDLAKIEQDKEQKKLTARMAN